jgi:hypothetical protein
VTTAIVSLIAVALAIALGDWLGRAIDEWKK